MCSSENEIYTPPPQMPSQSFPPPPPTTAPTFPPPQIFTPPHTTAEAFPPLPLPAARVPPPPTPLTEIFPPPQALAENIPPPPSTAVANIPPPQPLVENIPPPQPLVESIPSPPSTLSENIRAPPPTLEELSRRGVRELFLPHIRNLISNSSSPPPPPGSPREFLLLVNFRTGALRMLEASGSMIGGKHGPLPASKASIEALRCVDVDEGFECSICLGEGLQDVNEMPCKHLFHSGCINKWLGIHGSCPICRVRMPVEVEGMGGLDEEGAGADAEDRFLFHIYMTRS
ncbi:hypothetical protein LIER_41449 [Lithospermum erythrorhizon]|uniref:RING-type E3 ubiquitin transferase n=1 Tax=Lithospermum erythrorhizon TaxID=34254 RepID=A0AAV3RAQ5_LITER